MDCNHIKNLLSNYIDESIKVESGKKECNLIFPIFGHDSDLIDFYIRESDEKNYRYYITDKGETIATLYTLGVEMKDDGTRNEILQSIGHGLNVLIKNDEIIAYANDNDLGLTLSKIISAILGVQYLRYISRPIHIPTFKRDVKIFLDDNRPDYAENVPIKGYSGEFKFHFSYIQQDLYIDTLYATQVRDAQLISDEICLKKIDIKEIHPAIKIAAIYDDVDKIAKNVWKEPALKIMNNYLDRCIPWSKKEKLLEIIQ